MAGPSAERLSRLRVDRVSQALAERVRLLTERYALPLPALEDQAQELGAKVAEHLKRMGFAA